MHFGVFLNYLKFQGHQFQYISIKSHQVIKLDNCLSFLAAGSQSVIVRVEGSSTSKK